MLGGQGTEAAGLQDAYVLLSLGPSFLNTFSAAGGMEEIAHLGLEKIKV